MRSFKILVIYILLSTFILNNHNHLSIQALKLTSYSNISVSEAYMLIGNTSSLFILDVRTEGEYSAGHINNSYLLPYTDIISRQDELPENKSQPILVYCRSGMRSAIASATLVDLSFTTVFNMLNGLLGWLDANYPLEIPVTESTKSYLSENSVIEQNLDLEEFIVAMSITSALVAIVVMIGGIITEKKNQRSE